jgi:hypothetical protein
MKKTNDMGSAFPRRVMRAGSGLQAFLWAT